MHFPVIVQGELLQNASGVILQAEGDKRHRKEAATRELINWIRALRSDPDFKAKELVKGKAPYLGILFKKSPDYAIARNFIDRRR